MQDCGSLNVENGIFNKALRIIFCSIEFLYFFLKKSLARYVLKQHVACDNKLESGLKRDRCGVCGGDSSKCRFVERKWNEKCPGFGKYDKFMFNV